MSGTPNRRPSLAAVSPAVSGRRLSSGITPNVATPAVDSSENRRGSLRDLPNERDVFGAALRQHNMDVKSGKLTHCTYPAIRDRLLTTKLDVLPSTITKGTEIITLDGATDPVEAFDHLIDTGLEAIPVTSSQYHTHNMDGTVTIHSSHQQYPALYKIAKEAQLPQQHPQSPSTPVSQFQTATAGDESPPVGAAQPSNLPKSLGAGAFTTPSKALGATEQVLVVDLSSFTPSFHTTTPTAIPATPSVAGAPAAAPTPARSLRESLTMNISQTSNAPVAGCNADCPFRQAAGWLDIRDLASCIVYVYQQPVNEDLLEFREGGGVEQQPFVINTRGLDGITDLPGLTKSSSYSSHNSEQSVTELDQPSSNTSSLAPHIPEEASPVDSMGIVYEDDEAKVQGQKLKASFQQARTQGGFSHRLSLAPMLEEEDTFDVAALDPASTTGPEDDISALPSTPTSASARSASTKEGEADATPEGGSRSRSQSRHRRKMVSADELSSHLTEGGQQAWINTLKHGLGKFAAVGNISTAYLSRRHPLRSVKSTASLYDVFKLLSANHAHRVVVLDDKTQKMSDIISHRTIIKWLWDNKDSFFQLSKPGSTVEDNTITDGDETSEVEPSDLPTQVRSLLDKNIDDLNLGTRNLIQVRNDILGLDALQEMDENSRTGLAVVDDQGRLVGATSSRTIKRITHDRDHKTMSQPLLGFIEPTKEELEKPADVDEGCMVSHGAVVLFDDDVTFLDVLRAMYIHNTNRVFLVDELSYPTKVISLSDILQLILY